MLHTLEHHERWEIVTEYRLDSEPFILRIHYPVTVTYPSNARLESAEGQDAIPRGYGTYLLSNGVQVGTAELPPEGKGRGLFVEQLPIPKPRGKHWIYRNGDWIKQA